MLISAACAIAIIAGGAYYFATRGSKRRRPTSAGRVPSVVTNARVYTVSADPAKQWAEAFAIDENGTISFVGSTKDALRASHTPVKVLDAQGNFIMPGFHDVHVHVPEAGLHAMDCVMPKGRTLEAYATRAENCAKRTSHGWVRGNGASLRDFLKGGPSPLKELDKAVKSRPAIILGDLGHVVWVNSAALAAGNIAQKDPNPPGGVLQRAEKSGDLNGLLLEGAQHRVRDLARHSPDETLLALLNAQKTLAAKGVTSISDAGGYWPQGFVEAFRAAEENGRLTMRANNAVYLYPDRKFEEQMPILQSFFQKKTDDKRRLSRVGTVVIFVDGSIDIRTAALVREYDGGGFNETMTRGFYYFKRTTLYRYALELHKVGFQLHFHTVGDGAVRRALDTVEYIAENVGVTSVRARRHRFTHLYLVRPEQMSAFARFGIIADFQLNAFRVGQQYEEDLWPIVGKTRAGSIMPISELVDAGARVTLSSDWDADELDPLGSMMHAMTRRRFAVKEVEKVIRMTTKNAAYALHQDNTGSIEVGKQADFVILDRDLMKVKKADVGKTEVLITAVNGRIVFNKTETDAKEKG